MGDRQDSSWTRALMASSGIALGHEERPHHESAEWHEAAASDTPLGRLQKLAVSRESAVRYVVARRPDCPMGVLAALAYDSHADVRAGVAGNPRITEAVADHLARDRDATVVKVLARNHAIPLALLERLSLHRKEDVRRVAARHLDERVHGADGTTFVTGAAEALERPEENPAPAFPTELMDRVVPPEPWQYEARAVDARRADWLPAPPWGGPPALGAPS